MIRFLAWLAAVILALGAMLAPPPAQGQSGLPPAPYAYKQIDDPAKEAQARELMHELRCLVCQGQSIAASDEKELNFLGSLAVYRLSLAH